MLLLLPLSVWMNIFRNDCFPNKNRLTGACGSVASVYLTINGMINRSMISAFCWRCALPVLFLSMLQHAGSARRSKKWQQQWNWTPVHKCLSWDWGHGRCVHFYFVCCTTQLANLTEVVAWAIQTAYKKAWVETAVQISGLTRLNPVLKCNFNLLVK